MRCSRGSWRARHHEAQSPPSSKTFPPAFPYVAGARGAAANKSITIEAAQGLGAALLKNALPRCLQASESVGARAVLVRAVVAEAKAFYQHFGFEKCAVDDLPWMLLIKDIPNSV